MTIDPDDPENDQLTESPRETYEQWGQRKMRAEKNYPLERAAADRKTIREIRDLVHGLQHLTAEKWQDTIEQTKQRVMWVLLQNQVRNQSHDPESEKRLEELTKSNQELSHKMEQLLSFYSPTLRERTRSELDLRAETFVRKLLANRSRKRK